MGVRQWLTRTLTAPTPYYGGAMVPQDVRAAVGAQLVPDWERGKTKWTEQRPEWYDRKAYRAETLVFACVRFLAESASAAPLRLRQEGAPGQYDWRDDRDLSKILRQPNVGTGGSQFIDLVVTMAAISGFCVIEKERDRAGNVINLWPLNSAWVHAVPRNDGLTDWEYRVPGRDPVMLDAADTVDFIYAPTMDQRETGISPIEVLWKSIDTSTSLTDYLKWFIDKGAMPMYFAVLNTDENWAPMWNDQSNVDAFRQQWAQRYQRGMGGGDANNVMISPAVKDVKPLGFNMNELAYVDLNDRIEVEICEAFGIPPILVNAFVGLKHGTYSNYEQARKHFHEGKLTNLWGRIDDAFSRQLLPEFERDTTFDLVFDTSKLPAFQEDQDQIWARATAAVNSGWISTYMAQRLAGVPEHGDDVFLRSMGTVEIPVVRSSQRSSRAELVRPLAIRATINTEQATAVQWFDATFPEYAGLLDGRNGWSYDPDALQYVNEDGRTVSGSDMVDMRNSGADALGGRIAEIVEDTNTDNQAGIELVMLAMVALYLLGRGGTAYVDAADAPKVAELVTTQQEYWAGFMRDLAMGTMSAGQATARAILYGGSVVQVFSLGQAAAWGADRMLPYWPTQGSECKQRCRCWWSYNQFEDGARSAWWNDTHDSKPPECVTCWRRSEEYPQFAPFLIRGADPSGKQYPRIGMDLR